MSSCQLQLSEATAAMQGQLQGADRAFAGVSTDTRRVAAGQLFVALQGPNFDGHDFVAEAAARGAVGAVVSRPVAADLPQIQVADTRLALAHLAAHWRGRFSIPVVAVTGSNGKTTVKEMIATILGHQGPVLATQGNLNNEIGVPLTLLQLGSEHCAAVIEEGASHVGDIAYLSQRVQPTVGVVTNAAGAHLQGFGTLEAVARTKGELFEFVTEDGVCVINADDTYCDLWRWLASTRRVMSFGLEQEADVRGKWDAHQALQIATPAGALEVELQLAGRHNAMNALAATAAALAAGAELAAVKAGLESLRPVAGRLQWKPGLNGARLLDDTYNANPASLAAALAVLADCEGERYLALGDMAELGAEADSLHAAAGREARDAGVQRLYTVGSHAAQAAQAFGAQAWHFSAQAPLVECLRRDLHADVTLLVKGSRSAHMERVVAALGSGGGD
jgi:UDP-N-acetylmuramoyl-tripeptide--D-alanyl-D-alanine ligase